MPSKHSTKLPRHGAHEEFSPAENTHEPPSLLRTRSAALACLARREYSALELRSRLLDKGYSSVFIDQTLAELQAEGLQNDRRFIESRLRTRIAQGKGPRAIELEARQHGIPADVLSQALADADINWSVLAQQVLLKRFKTTNPTDLKERAKQYRFLLSRGFDPRRA